MTCKIIEIINIDIDAISHNLVFSCTFTSKEQKKIINKKQEKLKQKDKRKLWKRQLKKTSKGF